MNLGQLFEFAVGRAPNKIALVDGNYKYTFRQLEQEVNRVASSLNKLGIGYKDRVMVLMKNRHQAVCVFWALQKLGAIFAPVNFHHSSMAIKYFIKDIEPKAIIYEDFIEKRIPKVNLTEPPIYINLDSHGGDLSYNDLVRNESGRYPIYHSKPDDIAVILYTSGTTGLPKGVPRSHYNEYSATLSHIIQHQYQSFEHTLGVMPLYHIMGLRTMIAMAVLNGKYVALPDFDSELILSSMSAEHISCLYMMPTMYYELLSVGGSRSEFALSSVKKIGYAGDHMTPDLIQVCKRLFKPDIFVNHYGSTEVYTFSTCTHVGEKPGSVGRPDINQNLRLVSVKPGATINDDVATGEIGQVIMNIRSPEAFKGYWNRAEETREAIHGEWYLTGDIGRFDDGELYILGRVDQMVISGGIHVSPLKVEEILESHPKVSEASVIGETDERWGQIVVAYIVPKDDSLSVLELDRFCKRTQLLSSFEQPRKYVFTDELPQGHIDKVLKHRLMSKGGAGI